MKYMDIFSENAYLTLAGGMEIDTFPVILGNTGRLKKCIQNLNEYNDLDHLH